MATLTKPPMTLARMADSTELPPYIVFNSLRTSLLLNIFLSFEVGIAHANANFK